MKWKCSEGHQWDASFDNIKNKNSWCPSCCRLKYSLRTCKNLAKSRGGECLSKEYKNSLIKMKWRCSEGHEWENNLNNTLLQKQWCVVCNGQNRYTLEDCQNLANSHRGECLSKKYIAVNKKMKWRCSEGHEWETVFDLIKRKGTWCPYCSKYKSEEFVKNIFEELTNNKFIKLRPNWMFGNCGKPLEFDGYCEELNLAFEYNGEQHYKFIKFFHRSFNKFKLCVENDIIKYNVCNVRKINLIIIPYTIKMKNIREYILSEILRLNCGLPINLEHKKLFNFVDNISNNSLSKL